MWVTRAHNTEPSQKTPTYERGTYIYFDITTWKKVCFFPFLSLFVVLSLPISLSLSLSLSLWISCPLLID